MNNKTVILAAFFISLIAIIISIVCILKVFNQPRIAFVKSQELVYGYLGMQEAHSKYSEKVKEWQSNKQVLESDFQKDLAKYKEEAQKLSDEERAKRENYLQKLQDNLKNYMISISKMEKEEDEKMTQAVLNQINSYAEEYGKQNGYDFILGTTISGNILYGDSGLDITDKLLDAFNNAYIGEEDH